MVVYKKRGSISLWPLRWRAALCLHLTPVYVSLDVLPSRASLKIMGYFAGFVGSIGPGAAIASGSGGYFPSLHLVCGLPEGSRSDRRRQWGTGDVTAESDGGANFPCSGVALACCVLSGSGRWSAVVGKNKNMGKEEDKRQQRIGGGAPQKAA